VSALSTVRTLTLAGMRRVTDVSALSTVHTLTLAGMNRVTDVINLLLCISFFFHRKEQCLHMAAYSGERSCE
jgi:hypothetical protein